MRNLLCRPKWEISDATRNHDANSLIFTEAVKGYFVEISHNLVVTARSFRGAVQDASDTGLPARCGCRFDQSGLLIAVGGGEGMNPQTVVEDRITADGVSDLRLRPLVAPNVNANARKVMRNDIAGARFGPADDILVGILYNHTSAVARGLCASAICAD